MDIVEAAKNALNCWETEQVLSDSVVMELNHAIEDTEKVADELSTIRAKLAEAERDAARYRYLRANCVHGRMESRGPNPDFALNCDEPESEWDAAIDAAMPSTSHDKEVG